MWANAIVEVLDAVGDGDCQIEFRGPTLSIERFELHRSPERLHRRVVISVNNDPNREEPELMDVLAEAPQLELRTVV